MSIVQTSTARGQKRKRSPEIDTASDSTLPPEPPWKKAGFQSAEEANTAFWDNLSKVPLCSPALRELDRRNSFVASSTTESTATPPTRPLTRSAAVKSAARVNALDFRNSTALQGCSVKLKRFARRGGPTLDNLRGYPKPPETVSLPDAMSKRKTSYGTPSASGKSTTKTGRTSTYNPAFQQNLIDHGIYPDGYRHLHGRRPPKPDNWEEIQQMMTRPRPSLSPSRFSDGAFEAFVDENAAASTEKTVLRKPLSTLVGNADIPSEDDLPFGNLAPLTDGTIVNPQPDYYNGARAEQLNRPIRNELGSYIIPSTNHCAPIAPNFFTQGKGPNGSRDVAKRQSCYDGAIGARAMQTLQSYGQLEPIYDNNAYTITSTFDGEHLHMYTTHPTAPAGLGARPKYHMNQLKGWVVTSDVDAFRQGVTAYRNARDWAKEKRDEFIEAANERASSLPLDMSLASSGYSEPSTATNRVSASESDTSADDLALNEVAVAPRSGKRVKRD